MKLRRFFLILTVSVLLCAFAGAESFEPLPMDSTAIAPPPRDECYLSDSEYKDDSISVTITEGEYLEVHYWCARVKISHPSQLRTVPAMQVDDPNAVFSATNTSEAECTRIARAANAVIAVNGDYVSNLSQCNVVLRQGMQIRNMAHNVYDVLIIDNDGNFDYLPECSAKEYIDYYMAHEGKIYQAFCFGPVMVKDDEIVLGEHFKNGYMISQKPSQRMAIAQVGDLDYMLITCAGEAQFNKSGLTIREFADLCRELGRQASPGGLRMAYNLDGGNSASMVFKRRVVGDTLDYVKLNMPERDRSLSDMICFVSLVR